MPTAQTSMVPARADAKTHRNTRVTGKLADAIHFMIEEGLPWNEAALKANLTVRAMRLALARPHVVKALKDRREVFRAHVSAANIHRAREIRDQNKNQMAAIGAMRFIEQLGDEQHVAANTQQLPGLVVVVNTFPRVSADPPTIDVSQRVLTHD